MLVAPLAACDDAPAPPSEEAAITGPVLDADGVEDRTVTLAPPEHGFQITTEPSIVGPGEERNLCSVIRAEPDAPDQAREVMWMDTLESLVSTGSHHMNVFLGPFTFYDAFVGEGAFEAELGVPLGTYDCDDLGSLMERAYPVFPSQRSSQRITLPRGVAVPLTRPAVLVVSHHFVNPTGHPIRINAALNVEVAAASTVEHVASLVFDTASGFSVPAGGSLRVGRTCVFDREVQIALVSTHTHQLATCTSLHHFTAGDDRADVQPFFVNKWWETPPILHFAPGIFRLAPGDGVHYACHYTNPTGHEVRDGGTAQDEMCVFAAVTWPAPLSVPEVEARFARGDLAAALELLNVLFGACDRQADDTSPWVDDMDAGAQAADFCAPYEQTQSNTLR